MTEILIFFLKCVSVTYTINVIGIVYTLFKKIGNRENFKITLTIQGSTEIALYLTSLYSWYI